MAVAGGACPSCGAPIEFSVGSSVAKVCDFCKATVYRTDRGLQDLGKVAAIADVPALIAVGDEGLLGGRPIRVLGRVQLDQGDGPWNEWYVALTDTGAWAWLAYAEGVWFVTSEVSPTPAVPAFASLRVEQDVPLGPSGIFRVGEVKAGRVVSAEGELPAAFPPNLARYFADAHAPGNRFATIDYGASADGQSPVTVFVGARLEESALVVRARGPRSSAKVPLSSLRCPNCGGDIPKLAGERAQSIACRYCGAVTDITSQRVVFTQDQARAEPPIPLGNRGQLGPHGYVCIAYLRRSSVIEGERYAWEEQLLFSESGGYRWLVLDEGAWLLVEAMNIADVDLRDFPSDVRVGGQRYHLRNSNQARVDYVLGETYWRCRVGETVQVGDYAAGRVVLSREETPGEVHWSRSEAIPWPVIARAFGVAKERVASAGSSGGGSGAPLVGPGAKLAFILVIVAVVIVLQMTSSGGGGAVFIPSGGTTFGGSGHYYGGK